MTLFSKMTKICTPVYVSLTKVVHGEHVNRAAQHAHGGHGRAEQPRVVSFPYTRALPEVIRRDDRHTNGDARHYRTLHADGDTGDDVGPVPRCARLRDASDRGINVVRVVLEYDRDAVRERDGTNGGGEGGGAS